MRVFSAQKEGWRLITSHVKLWLFLYICNLVFALIAAIPLRGWINHVAGHSTALAKSIAPVDFTFITDLIRNYGGFAILWNVICMIALIYVLFSVFLSGGILDTLLHPQKTDRTMDFLSNGMRYFWRMLKVALFFLVIQLAILAIVIGIVIILGVNPKEMNNDLRFLLYLKIIVPVYVLIAMIIAMTHDYVKIHIVQDGQPGIWSAFKAGAGFVSRHFVQALALYLINMFILAVLIVGYYLIKKAIPGGTMAGLMLTFVFGQMFLFGRIGVKLLTLSSECELRNSDFGVQKEEEIA